MIAIVESKPIKRVILTLGRIEWCAEIHDLDTEAGQLDLAQAVAQANILAQAVKTVAQSDYSDSTLSDDWREIIALVKVSLTDGG